MRLVIVTLALLVAGVCDEAWAQCTCGYPDTCSTPCPRCVRHVYVKQPCASCEEQQTPGAYSAPAPTGTAVGETNGVGLQGMGIHFPAFTLQLPSIQLPSAMRYRREAYFLANQTPSAFVTDVNRRVSVPATAPPARQALPPTTCTSASAMPVAPANVAEGSLPPNPERDADRDIDAVQPNHIRQSSYEAKTPASYPRTNDAAVTDTRDADLRAALLAADRRAAELEGQMRRLETLVDRLATAQEAARAPAAVQEPVEAPAKAVQPRQTKTTENQTLTQKLFTRLR